MARKQPAAGLAAEIVTNIPPVRHGLPAWEKRIGRETLAELEQVREAWRNGAIDTGAANLARRISETLRQRGLSNIGEQGVLRWLNEKRRA